MLARTPMCQTYLALMAVITTSCYALIIHLSSSLFILSALFVEDVHDVVVSIAHRGRLNLLTCVLQLEPVIMFRKVDTSVLKLVKPNADQVTTVGDLSPTDCADNMFLQQKVN